MPLITYIAKRNIEETDFYVASDDISVVGSGGSPDESPPVNRFQIDSSPSNSLAGLSDGQWVHATGFDQDENNGWFEANGDSTSSLINVTQDLYDEASGAAVVLQGHVRGAGQSYELEFNAERIDLSSKITRNTHVPIGGGAGETILQRKEDFIELTTGSIDEDSITQWEEFIASVAARETFTIDLYGTSDTPDNPQSVVLESEDHDRIRIGTLRKYQYKFRLKVVG